MPYDGIWMPVFHRKVIICIVKEAAAQTTNSRMVSCHSMRKTFGYHAWKQGTQPALLMGLFNHSSYDVTKRYLGIEQDEKDSVYLKIDL